jgi:hypothetical protein
MTVGCSHWLCDRVLDHYWTGMARNSRAKPGQLASWGT